MEKIIIRMPNWIGDLVMATPIISDMRAHYPDAQITAICQPSHIPLLEGNPCVNGLLPLGKLTQRYDIGILLPNSFSSAWTFWRSKIKRRIGFATDWRRLLLTDAVPSPKERGWEHLVVTYKRLLKPLGIELSSTLPSLHVTKESQTGAEELLARLDIPENGKILGVNPGAAYGSAKCWLPERFRELTERLLAENPEIHILYFGDKTSSSLVEQICQGLPARVHNLCNQTTLAVLLALIQKCNLFLTNDSGPMHIAAALKRPLVALFGSTNEVATGPYKQGTVIHKHVSCSPCYLRTCPTDFRCMKGISVEEVYNALGKWY